MGTLCRNRYAGIDEDAGALLMVQPDKSPTETSIRPARPTRIIFLDIDGVLQPPSSQKRFRYDLEALRENLAQRFGAEYREVDRYDLGAVVHDWHAGAVARLRALCEDHGARIVVSSDWRLRRTMAQLQALFRLHDLHHLVVDRTADASRPPHYRAGEVKQYLDAHPEIARFVIIDDGYRTEFDELFPDQFVHTGSYIDEPDALRARQILSGGPVTQENRRLQPLVFHGDYRSLFG